MTESKIKIEISKDFLESVIEFQETQKTRIREVIKTFSEGDISSLKFTLLCEYLVLVNGYIDVLEDTLINYMIITREIQQALDQYEYDLTGQGISLLTH